MKRFIKKTLAIVLSIVTLTCTFCTAAMPVFAANYSTNYSSYQAPSSSDYAYWNGNKVVKASDTTKSEIQWMQAAMNYCITKKGLNATKLDVDGSFGPASKKTCTAFQKKYGLKQDGSFGPDTIAKMKSVLGAKTSSNTTSFSSTLSSKYYTKLNAFTVGSTKYYEVKLTSAYKGVSKGTIVYITTNGNVVTNKDTLNKLFYTSIVNSCKSNWISLANTYKSGVTALNSACQSVMSAQFKQKVLGSISGSFTSIMLSKNPKSLISSCTYLTEEGYIDLLTGILLDQITDVAITNSNAIKNMCSDGVNSYEEAVKVKNALVNAKMAFDFAGSDCMYGLASKYTNMSSAVKSSLKTHFSSMFNTLVGTYSKKLADVVDLYSNGSTCLDALKNIYGYNKYLNGAQSTYNNLIDGNVNKGLSALISTQNKLK
ncbi:MAG: peptidoglycan-binding protein [Lachnospiraceae bacterium]|nr:peptidoglycan-binding protein [Lachnospiraceae bacterium]